MISPGASVLTLSLSPPSTADHRRLRSLSSLSDFHRRSRAPQPLLSLLASQDTNHSRLRSMANAGRTLMVHNFSSVTTSW
ncbi:Hypothetical predicted protein [Olea europaea subsp. europaea]|uniref:Uncharacterized protein n=1 Tax=Olea europaea subsp. europaea TaxID=158383 RepID=A0A8S0TTE1_OLEEU|nr:Hypothetical predicted protein [Olea europaea subsp. europaea]